MKVHIVTEGNWIKKFWSDKILEYNQTDMNYSVSYGQRFDVDINFYICYNVFLNFSQKTKRDIAYVTHIHANDPKEHSKDLGGADFNRFKLMNAWVHQSQRSLQQFLNLGFPQERNYNLTSPIEIHKFKPTIKIGIFQNGEVVGKGLYFMLDLVNRFNLSNFKFIFCGRGWEVVTNRMNQLGIRNEVYRYTPDEYKNVKQSELYEKIDFLLIPSLWEGGPVAPEEAMACGIPIISSDVGFIPEFNVEYMFPAGNITKLIDILVSIEDKVLKRRQKVEQLTYINFNNKLKEIFSEIIEKGY